MDKMRAHQLAQAAGVEIPRSLVFDRETSEQELMDGAASLGYRPLIANVSVSTTEYSAALFAGQVGLFAVVLPYLFFTLLSLVIGSISSLTSNLCLARIDRNLRRMVWKKVVHLPLQFYEANNPKELLSRITTDVTSISTLIMQVLLRCSPRRTPAC